VNSSQIRILTQAAVIVSMWVASFCSAATLQEATSAKDRGDFAVAFSQFKQLAASGDAAAQFQLSLLYGSGRGTKLDAKEALYWLRVSATHGNPQAQSNLGVAFSKGRGVVPDPIRAYAWFAAAAASGDSVAITNRDVAAGKLSEQQLLQAKALLIQCQRTGFAPCL
jgi:TPR repeat protein